MNPAAALADITVFRQFILAAVRQVFEKLTFSGGELAPVCFIVTDEGVALMPAEEEARRARAKARNATDDQWHQRRLAVLDRLAKLLKISVEDRKMR